jgi:23S rRNA (cytidine1920-2'-O)/16S rRNA (cytidine1409-2'-O)-methyltransferase
MRVDQLLVQRGLAPTRSAAQRLIARGAVRWLGPNGWTPPRKAGDDLPESSELELVDDAEVRWVSRGGLKLAAALTRAGVDPAGRVALDIGQSTGGFTDVLLARGASRVVGVDVGHGQLHPRLRDDPRVLAFEGVNARHLAPADLGGCMPPGGFDLVTGDLSFISLSLVLPALAGLAAPGADLLLLVKPQFEGQPGDRPGAAGRGREGPQAEQALRRRLEADATAAGLQALDWFDSPITGGDGNREHFIHARRLGAPDRHARPIRATDTHARRIRATEAP